MAPRVRPTSESGHNAATEARRERRRAGSLLRQHIASCPGARIDRGLVIFRVIDANVLATIRVDTRATCAETDASVPAQIVIQLGSGRKAAGSIALKQPIELGGVLAGKGARPNGDFRFNREGRSLSSRRVREQQGGADDVYGLYRQLRLTLRYNVPSRQQATRAPAWPSNVASAPRVRRALLREPLPTCEQPTPHLEMLPCRTRGHEPALLALGVIRPSPAKRRRAACANSNSPKHDRPMAVSLSRGAP